MRLIQDINKLRNSEIKVVIESRLREFSSFETKNDKEWFSELCFCLLTANSKASTAINIQNELGHKGFLNKNLEEIRETIKRNKHRFHNNKGSYIVDARNYKSIKKIIVSLNNPREWLVKNIKGLGYKEASHFLRNVGYFDYSILDRHIINLMADNGRIEKPKKINKKGYLEIEKEFRKIADEVKMSLGELDLYMWYLKTGKILK
ncbi:N-glycosylase/DNA lyase [Candidatus Woesearchaeota archaeon]|nr:N-glycosylase/DNA lyase [Candidatus Woesearchaeota archaeon]